MVYEVAMTKVSTLVIIAPHFEELPYASGGSLCWLQDPLVQQYYSRVRRCCYVLDDIPDWADLGPYW